MTKLSGGPCMRQEILTLYSKSDGLPLSVAKFAPDTDAEIKGIVQISHGMAEHKERYFPFMEYLVSKGYAAVINDHRGHGASVKSKDDLGYFYDESGRFIMEDLHQITQDIKEHLPGKPVYLFGHSMGSMVVRDYIKKYDDQIEKLIVCGSPSYPESFQRRQIQERFHSESGFRIVFKEHKRLGTGFCQRMAFSQ